MKLYLVAIQSFLLHCNAISLAQHIFQYSILQKIAINKNKEPNNKLPKEFWIIKIPFKTCKLAVLSISSHITIFRNGYVSLMNWATANTCSRNKECFPCLLELALLLQTGHKPRCQTSSAPICKYWISGWKVTICLIIDLTKGREPGFVGHIELGNVITSLSDFHSSCFKTNWKYHKRMVKIWEIKYNMKKKNFLFNYFCFNYI